jgi:hypothetical protein
MFELSETKLGPGYLSQYNDRLGRRVPFEARIKYFSLHLNAQNDPGTNPTSYVMGEKRLFLLEVKRPGSEAYH